MRYDNDYYYSDLEAIREWRMNPWKMFHIFSIFSSFFSFSQRRVGKYKLCLNNFGIWYLYSQQFTATARLHGGASKPLFGKLYEKTLGGCNICASSTRRLSSQLKSCPPSLSFTYSVQMRIEIFWSRSRTIPHRQESHTHTHATCQPRKKMFLANYVFATARYVLRAGWLRWQKW